MRHALNYRRITRRKVRLNRLVAVVALVLIGGSMVWLLTHLACKTPLENTVALLVLVSTPVIAGDFISREA